MKKVKNILLLLTAIFTLGCTQTIVFEDIQTPTPTPTPKPEPDFDSSSYIDLSAEGTANCYLVKAAGKYKLKAVKGNSTQSVGAASSATVLWESFGTSNTPNVGDLIASATYKDGYVYFATPTTFKSGNASIAVRDSNAKILWSWHIWLSKEGWKDDVYPNNAGTMMDRNLGATSATPGSVGSLGLLYQWGRKDPFLGSGATSGTTIAESTGAWNIVTVKQSIDYTIENPMTFIGGPGEWCSTEDVLDYARRWNDSVKTMHDPCPVGYRVPDGGETGFWATAHTGSTWDSTNKGRNWSLPDGTTAWYPATGYRDLSIGSLRLVGYYGDYWSASPYPSDPSYSYLLSFGEGDSNITTANSIQRGFGYSVRCVSTTENPKPDPESMPANNEIWYTSTDGKVVTPAGTGYFNVSITSNTYSNGKGVITFSGPLTTVGEDEGEEPFANCANLKSVVLPNGLKTIGYGAFSLCSGLESVTIPETVTYIKSGAFYDCNKLTAIALPSGLLRIDDNAFASCDLVESVTIPDSVIEIGGNAFSGEKLTTFDGKYASSDKKLIVVNKTVICAALGGLTEYSIPNAVEKIGFSAFNGYKNIKKFTIPNSVVSIGDGSFSYCTSLQDITIPDSVTEIVGGSFFNCTSLTSAILSKNLTKIGDATFMNCSKLKNIYCSAVTPPQCGKDLFEGVTTDFKIYVPASSVSAYKSASGWSTYADAIVADPSTFTSAPYAVGDYYNDGTKEGVVFEVWDNGNSGKIVGMMQSTDTLQWSSDVTEQERLIGADSETDGAYNTAKVKAISGWETKYPAFKWCADLGDGWYLPAKEELITMCNNKDKLDTNLTDKLSSYYWSSTEDDYQSATGRFSAWFVRMNNGTTDYGNKFNPYNVRAAATFGDTPKPEPEPDFDSSSYIDLSAAGTANCYLVKAAGKYKFKVVKGNSTQSVGSASSATVLWESFGTSTTPNEGDLIASATYKDGYVYFATPTTFNSGNASIAVRDSNDTVLWSWHIWLSKEGWNDHVYANNAGTMMDRNLGATSATPGSVGALGLMYQWGRKDPFLGSSSVSSSTLAVSTGTWSSVTTQQTVDYVTANPMTFVRQNYEWCTGDGAEDSNYAKRWTESTKSMYDPCPVGYRVPDGGKNGFWATALGTSSSTTAGITWYSTYYGCLWTLSDGKLSAWYPIVGCRDTSGGALGNVGSIGYYWSASPHASDGERAYYLCFYDSKVSPMNYVNRCLGQSVRCVSTTATSEPTPGITSDPYAVGDYYNDGTKEGVVFEVSADGTSGKIVSMMQSTGTLQWSSDETEQKRLIGADSETDGAYNTAKVKAISGWETKYPAFKWCADLGDGWYLPAKEELLTIYNNKDKLNTNLTNKLSSIYYWSSTEYDDQLANGQFRACSVNLGSGTYRSSKYLDYYVRAVTTF
ncbi:MAG: DUF1566 domain-containing protein [Rikenellaceae bacterium]|nr:DUF1566 domain-containing protein [Rikenellaceae bacterium]